MLYRLSIFCLLFTVFSIDAQVKLQTTDLDFGDITERHDRIADMWMVNTSGKKLFIFRMDVPKHVQVRYSTKELHPGDTAFIRLKYDPQKKGVFREEAKLHLSASEQPISIYLNGKSSITAQNELDIPCPDFGQLSPNAYFEADIQVVESPQDFPLKDVKLTIYKGGKKLTTAKTDKNGRFVAPMQPGWHYFIAELPGYEPYETALYVNRRTRRIDIPLTKIEAPQLPAIVNDIPEKPSDSEENITVELPNQEVATPPETVVIEVLPTAPEEAPDSKEEIYVYVPNNLVFLLDVSSSMNVRGRLELLKLAMLDLLDIIGPNDKVTIITYASGVNTLLETTTGADKEEIRQIIQTLTARGLTAGEWGLKTAYETAQREYVDGGNNQVILISDGAFNEGSRSLNRIITGYYKKGIKLSVVAIHSKEDDTYLLHQAANSGGGNFIPIRSAENAHRALKEEVRTQSRRKK